LEIHEMTEWDGAELAWRHTVDRALVHRNAIAEVLLTDIVPLGPALFGVAVQWPRAHRVYRPDRQGRHDPMLLLETVRQVGLALSHRAFEVPFGFQSVMHDVGFESHSEAEPLALSGASNLKILVTCEDVVKRSEHLRSMTVVLRMYSSVGHFATGTGTISWLAPHTFRALRQRSLARVEGSPPIADGIALRTPHREAADSLLAAELDDPRGYRLLVPLNHPVYFDHALDHVPGMLIIDAAWQAASARLPPQTRLVGCRMVCPAFTELRGEAWLSLAAQSPTTLSFELNQLGRATANGVLTTRLDG
jgi:hypothetical protein